MEFPFKKAISAVLIAGQISLLFTSISSYAQDNNSSMSETTKNPDTSKNTFYNHVDKNQQQQGALESAHSSAYSWAKQAQNDLNKTSVNGTIVFGNDRLRNSEVLRNNPLNANDLTPATSPKINTTTNADGTTTTVDKYHYYANGHAPDLSQMQSVNSLEQTNIDTTSSNQVDRMNAELSSNNPSLETQAYSLIKQVTANRSEISPDDPMFTKSNEMIEKATPQLVFSCDVDNDIATASATVHNEVLKECVSDDVGEKNACTLRHFIYPSILMPTKAVWNPELMDANTGKYPTEEQQKLADSLNVANFGPCNDYTSNDDRYVCHSIGFGRPSKSDEHLQTGKCEKGVIETDLQLSHREAIVSAHLKVLKFAGNVKAYIGKTNGTLFDHSNLTCTPGVTNMGNPIDLTQDAFVNVPNGDITKVLKELSSDSFTLALEYHGAIPYMTIEIVYDASLITNDEEWTDSSCAQTATNIYDGKLKGAVECYGYFNGKQSSTILIDGTQAENAKEVYINGLTINKKYLKSIAGLPSNCALAKVTLDYSNYVDEKGEPYSEQKPIAACSTLKTVDANGVENPNVACRQHSKKCALYSGDDCVLYKYLYDCGYDTKTEVQQAQTTTNCPQTACVGNDCINIKLNDSSADFSKALGLMNMAQEVVDDISCSDGVNGENDLHTCVLFPGKSKKCNQSYFNGGLGTFGNDCCEDDVGSSTEQEVAEGVRQTAAMFTTNGLGDAIRYGDLDMFSVNFNPFGMNGMGTTTPNVGVPCGSAGGACANDLKADGAGMAGQLGWMAISNFTGAGQQFKAFTNKVVGGVANKLNNIIPYAGVVFSTVANIAIDRAMAYLTQMVMNWIWEMIGDAIIAGVEGVLGGVGLGAAGTAISEFTGAVVPVLGWVYAIYKIAQMIVNILTACKDDDFKLKQERDAHKCDFVTKWCSVRNYFHFKPGKCFQYSQRLCCFNSPLARIMNKQIRYSMKGTKVYLYPDDNPAVAFKTGKKSADCSGIPMDVFAHVDWKRIDLTEWLMLLQISGAIETGLDAMRNQFLPIGGVDNQGNQRNLSQQGSSAYNKTNQDREDLLKNPCFEHRNAETGQMETICPDANEVDKTIDEKIEQIFGENGEGPNGSYDNTEDLINNSNPGPQGSGSNAGNYDPTGDDSQSCDTPDCYCEAGDSDPECVCLQDPTNAICVSYCQNEDAEWYEQVCKATTN